MSKKNKPPACVTESLSVKKMFCMFIDTTHLNMCAMQIETWPIHQQGTIRIKYTSRYVICGLGHGRYLPFPISRTIVFSCMLCMFYVVSDTTHPDLFAPMMAHCVHVYNHNWFGTRPIEFKWKMIRDVTIPALFQMFQNAEMTDWITGARPDIYYYHTKKTLTFNHFITVNQMQPKATKSLKHDYNSYNAVSGVRKHDSPASSCLFALCWIPMAMKEWELHSNRYHDYNKIRKCRHRHGVEQWLIQWGDFRATSVCLERKDDL